MTSFTEKARAKVLGAAKSDDPISSLLPPKTNSFRLEMREALSSRRKERHPQMVTDAIKGGSAAGTGGSRGIPGGGIGGRDPADLPHGTGGDGSSRDARGTPHKFGRGMAGKHINPLLGVGFNKFENPFGKPFDSTENSLESISKMNELMTKFRKMFK
jgi:hypothetical protein